MKPGADRAGRIGLIGLGAMGLGMAQSLRRAGFAPQVFDLRGAVVEAFAREGGSACASAAALAAACDVVISVMVNAVQTEALPFGDGGVAAALRPGSVLVMCSTVDPRASVAFEERLAALGVHYLDAPISGGAAKAAAGQMTMMTAGTPAAHGACDGMLEAVKDLGLVLDTARATRFPLPLAAAAHQIFIHASSAGHGAEDDAAVIKIFPGITLPPKKAT
jgi:3-hydroxyisobutyrate dehydrogenase-like beta-hydroxyacid dehydrogenase